MASLGDDPRRRARGKRVDGAIDPHTSQPSARSAFNQRTTAHHPPPARAVHSRFPLALSTRTTLPHSQPIRPAHRPLELSNRAFHSRVQPADHHSPPARPAHPPPARAFHSRVRALSLPPSQVDLQLGECTLRRQPTTVLPDAVARHADFVALFGAPRAARPSFRCAAVALRARCAHRRLVGRRHDALLWDTPDAALFAEVGI